LNTRQKGTDKEQLAAEYLERQGMHILEKNFRARQGEIDLIGLHEGYLVFVEVKYRSNRVKGSAFDAVDTRKQRQVCKVADYYRMLHKVNLNISIRYDLVAIQGENEICWIKNAFPHIYRS
jgi:putative endonuclease